jgi:hypothetical protein
MQILRLRRSQLRGLAVHGPMVAAISGFLLGWPLPEIHLGPLFTGLQFRFVNRDSRWPHEPRVAGIEITASERLARPPRPVPSFLRGGPCRVLEATQAAHSVPRVGRIRLRLGTR